MEQKFAQLQAKMEADHSLVEKIFDQDSAGDVQRLLKEQELDFSLEEINMLRDGIVKVAEKGNIGANGELSDDDLEDVAGGIAVTAVIGAVCAIAGGVFGAGNFVHKFTRGRW